MKKLTLLFFASLILFNCESEKVEELQANPPCDNGTFIGDVFLENQREVDSFGALCYSKIDGSLYLRKIVDNWGPRDGETDFTDLSSLSSIKEIYGNFYLSSAVNLRNLNGLENLESVGEVLAIYSCIEILTLDELENLNQIGGLILFQNFELISIDGLQNISNRTLSILTLSQFQGPSLEALSNINNVIGNVSIRSNEFYSFSDLNLTNVGGSLSIRFNDNLNTLEGLGLTSVGGEFTISSNDNLENLNGLESLSYIGEKLLIGVYYSQQDTFIESENDILSDFCALQNLFVNGTYNIDDVYIVNSTYNPIVQDIIDGNCSQ